MATKFYRLFFILFSASVLTVSTANASEPDQACLTGDVAAQTAEAQKIVAALVNKPNTNEDTELDEIFSNAELADFYIHLNVEISDRGCQLSKHARKLDTIGEVENALVTKTFKIPPSDAVPRWLVPGFKAVIGSYDSNNAIFIETKIGGFVFHACEKEEGKPDSFAPPATEDCPYLLNKSVFVPVDQMLKKSNGVKHAILSTLKVLTGMSAIVAASMGLTYLTPIAVVTMTLMNPDPLGDIQNQIRVAKANRDLLQMGDKSAQMNSSQIVTRLYPYKYEDLKKAELEILGDVFRAEYRQLNRLHRHVKYPSLEAMQALKMEREFHDRVQAEYDKAQADKKAGVVVKPKPED